MKDGHPNALPLFISLFSLLTVIYFVFSSALYASETDIAELRTKAEQGVPKAQCSLGLLYANGEGVPKNSVEAYKWLNLAAANGYEDAIKRRSILERQMTRDQIAEAQRLSAGWQPKSSR